MNLFADEGVERPIVERLRQEGTGQHAHTCSARAVRGGSFSACSTSSAVSTSRPTLNGRARLSLRFRRDHGLSDREKLLFLD